MLLISICTLLMMLGFLKASASQLVYRTKLGEERRILRREDAFYLAAVLIIISSLRYGFIDTYAYKQMYKLSRNNWWYIFTGAGWGIETGWLFVNYVLNYVSRSPKLILFLSALIINTAFMKVSQKYSEDAALTFFLYYCLFYLDTNNGLRQVVAGAIVMLAFPKLEKKQYIQFAFWIFVAYQLHNSAAAWFAFAVVAMGKPLNTRTKAALLVGILFLFIPGSITGYIDTAMEESQYNYYLDMKGGMRLARAMVTGIIPGVLAILYYMKKKEMKSPFESTDALMFNLVIINTMFVLMGTYMQEWNRFTFYTLFAMTVAMPKYVRWVVGTRSYYSGIRRIMVILYFLYFCYNVYANSGLPGASSDSLQQFYIEWWC